LHRGTWESPAVGKVALVSRFLNVIIADSEDQDERDIPHVRG
jgi:hypothetical protein